jgi:F-type H+-transporting ATPase subunit delta
VAAAHRLYARALFEAAQEHGRLEHVREELAGFVAASREAPELGALLRDPQLDPRAKRAAIEALLEDADELVRNFVLLTIEKRRADQLDGIARELDRLVAAEEGRIEVELTTAVELSDEDARDLVAQIERSSGRTVEARRRVDTDLIGGLVLQAGSLRVDASVRGRLTRLRQELRTRS